MTLAVCVMILGYLTVVVGIGLWSLPAALIVGGLVLFLTGGLEAQKRGKAGV